MGARQKRFDIPSLLDEPIIVAGKSYEREFVVAQLVAAAQDDFGSRQRPIDYKMRAAGERDDDEDIGFRGLERSTLMAIHALLSDPDYILPADIMQWEKIVRHKIQTLINAIPTQSLREACASNQ